jgi:hypothetical protein
VSDSRLENVMRQRAPIVARAAGAAAVKRRLGFVYAEAIVTLALMASLAALVFLISRGLSV